MSESLLPPELDAKLEGQDTKDLANRAALGFDVQNFLRTTMGREICRRAEEERVTYVDRLIACNVDSPDGVAENKRLRFLIAVIDYWQEGLASLVNEGHVAEKELRERLES